MRFVPKRRMESRQNAERVVFCSDCNGVGRILSCAVEESVLTDGKPDVVNMKLICYDPCAHGYRIMGEAVAKAFSCGKEIVLGE